MNYEPVDNNQLDQLREARLTLLARFTTYKRYYGVYISPDLVGYTGTKGQTFAFDMECKLRNFHSENLCLGKLECIEGHIQLSSQVHYQLGTSKTWYPSNVYIVASYDNQSNTWSPILESITSNET